MRPDDLHGVNTVFAACYPSKPVPHALWWWSHPTVVIPDEARIVGYATFSISLPPTVELAGLVANEVGWGHGMAVHPDSHGQGVGTRLHAYRNEVMRALGLRFFIGHAHPHHSAMQAIFAADGLKATVDVIGTDGLPVTLYMGAIP